MPWYANLVDTPIDNIIVNQKLIPNRKYRVIKMGNQVDIHSKQDHRYIMSVTPEFAKVIFTKPYWENQ